MTKYEAHKSIVDERLENVFHALQDDLFLLGCDLLDFLECIEIALATLLGVEMRSGEVVQTGIFRSFSSVSRPRKDLSWMPWNRDLVVPEFLGGQAKVQGTLTQAQPAFVCISVRQHGDKSRDSPLSARSVLCCAVHENFASKNGR